MMEEKQIRSSLIRYWFYVIASVGGIVFYSVASEPSFFSLLIVSICTIVFWVIEFLIVANTFCFFENNVIVKNLISGVRLDVKYHDIEFVNFITSRRVDIIKIYLQNGTCQKVKFHYDFFSYQDIVVLFEEKKVECRIDTDYL